MSEEPRNTTTRTRLSGDGGFGEHIGFSRASNDALRESCVSDGGIERVWLRLEEQLEPAVPVPGRRLAWFWGGVVSTLTFVAGVWVGQETPVTRNVVSAQVGSELPRLSEPTVVPATPPLTESVPEPTTRARAPRRAIPRAVLVTPAPTVSDVSAVADGAAEAPTTPAIVGTAQGPIEPGIPEWQRLANGGDYEAALFLLSEVGGFESALQVSSAEQLMLLVDVARATGQQQRAIAALRRIVRNFSSDPVAPLASWSLGNLLDKAGDKRGAEQAFAVYRSLSPQGDFAEDALVRQIRSAVERQEVTLARSLVAQYESAFPDGERRSDIAKWLGQMQAASVGAAGESDAGAPAAEESVEETGPADVGGTD